MSDRRNFSTGNPWEREIGFSRAVRVGSMIFCAGTVAADVDGVIHGADCYEQCCYILEKLSRVLAEAGGSLHDVVRVTCYLTGLEHAPGFTRAHAQYFSDVQPAATCIAVAGLFGEGAVVELELTAVVGSSSC